MNKTFITMNMSIFNLLSSMIMNPNPFRTTFRTSIHLSNRSMNVNKVIILIIAMKNYIFKTQQKFMLLFCTNMQLLALFVVILSLGLNAYKCNFFCIKISVRDLLPNRYCRSFFNQPNF